MPRKFLGGKPTVGTTNTPVVIESRTLTGTDPVTIAGGASADLSSDRTIAVKDANTSGQKGVVSLTDSTSTTSSTVAATATAVKAAKDAADAKVPTTRTISTTAPLTGGGDLSTDRTIAIDDATTGQKGAVQLSDSTSTNASTKAATEKAVYETKLVADAAIPKSIVTTIGDLIIGAGSPAAPTRLAIGATSGSVLTSNGTTASWSAAPTLTNATIATPTLTLSTTTNNAEGRIAWDGTNDQISVGDGAAQAVFGKLTSTNPSDLGEVAVGNATTAARANHVHATTGLLTTSTATTKGDLYVATASGTVTRIGTGGSGNNGYVLTADSTATEGVKWAAQTGGGGGSTKQEAFGSITSTSGTIDYNYTTATVFYHTSSPTADWTVNFTNVPTDNNYAYNFTIVVPQGGTAYKVTAAQIAGASATIKWAGSTAAPAGNNSKTDVWVFSLFRVSGAWTVLGVQSANFG